ncbi:MAG: cadherin-like domain-containing protein [Xanthomonadales bacterium]|nr:cadherin-like domain-containing protein [Xanthomonadales bacterium]
MLKAFGVFVFLLFLSADVMAQPRQYEIYFDVDNSSGSGCQVLHAGLPDINGIESKVTIETNNQPPSIVSTTLSHCAGLAFDAGVATTPAALGFNTGDFGEDVFEAVLSQPELNIFGSGTVRVYFATGSNSAEDVVLAQASGDPVLLSFFSPIAIPTLGVLSILLLIVAFFLIGRFKLPRSFSVMIVLLAISPAVWAMTIIIDGQTGDWSGFSPSAIDPADDTSQAGSFADITSVYALNADDMIYLRMDIVDLENQAPVANDGLETSLEDTMVTLILSSSDADSDPITFNIDSAPVSGVLSAITVLDAVSSSVDYTPNGGFFGSDSFTFVANDGQTDSTPANFEITVEAVNDQPSFTTGGDVTVDEDSSAYSNTWATALLAGPVNESGQTLSFNMVSVSDASLFSVSPVVDAAGNLTFTPAVGVFGTSTVTLNIMDNGLTANGGVDTSTPDVSFDINITEVNDAPVLAVIGAQSIDELQQLAFIATATDSNTPAQNLSFSLSGEPTGATITAGGDFTWTPTESQGTVGSFTFDVVVTDDGANPANLTDSETIIVTVNKVNAAPVLANIGAQSIDELTQLTFAATATDIDLPVQSLSFSLSGTVPSGASITAAGVFTWTPTEAQGADVYTFNVIVTDNGTNPANLTDLETITVTVNEVNTAPVLAAIGNQSIDEETLLSFTAVAADSDLPAQGLTFSLSGQPAGASITTGGLFTWTPTEAQGPGMYPFSVVVTDNGTGTLSDSETINVTVIEVNAAPVADAQSTTTDDATPLLITLTGSDSEASALTFSIVAGPATGSLGAITQLTPTSASVTYTPGTAGNNSFTFRVNDGLLNSSAAAVTLNVSLSNQAPSAGADSYETIGNTGLHATTGVASTPIRHPNNVLVNDTDPDLDVLVVSALGVDTVAPFTGMTTLGGDVIMQVNGDFTYYPPAGMTSMLDTFMYTANDQNGGASVGNVSITITSDLVYYVDNTAPAGGDGRDNSRFDQLSDIPAAAANSTVYVFQGAGSTAGAITMGNNQRMLGSGVNLEFDVNNTLANPDVLFAASVRPILSGGTTLALNNTVAGLNFNTNSVVAINGANVGELILNNVDVTVNGGTQGINIGQANAMSNIVFGVINITNTSSQGINLSNNTGSVINFDSNLVINNTTGTGFNAIGGGTINVTGTGNSIVTTTAIAVNIDNTNIGTSNVTFQSISSNGGNTGINLNAVGGTGSFNVTGTGTTNGSGGTIQNKASNGILVQSSNNINLSNMNFTNATTTDTGAANSNAALEFNTAVNVNLVNLNLTGHLEHGILGVSVTNLDISNTTINGTGADTETNEHGIFITNLLGSGGAASVFDNLVINDSQDTAIRIINSTSTALVTIQNSTISNAGDTGINFITSNAAANLTGNVTGSTITNTVDGVSYESQAGALIGTVGGAGALSNTIAAGSNGDMVSGILFFANGPGLATVNGTANNNFITLDAVKIGGVAPVSGLNGVGIATGGMGTVRAIVSNNTINSSFSGVLSQTVHGVLASNEGTGTTAQNVIMINNNSITLNPAVGTATAETVGIGVDGGLNGGGMTVRSIDNTIIATGDASNGASVGVQILPTEFGDPNNTNSRVCIGFTGNNISTPNNPLAADFLTGELDVIAAPVALGSFLDVENSPLSVRTPAQLVMDLDAPLNTAEIGDATGSISGVITGVATCPF